MIIRLNANKEDVPFNFVVPSDVLDVSSNEVKFLGDVKIDGTFEFIGGGYLAKGNIEVNKKFTCDRCLKDVEVAENIPFEERFTIYETDDSTLFTGDEVDLTETVRDLILANEPIRHLCKEDCKGLCLICGHDLNDGECGCDRHIPDPRLSVLDDFNV